MPTGDGTATLPVKDLFAQIIEEAQPRLLLTIGTCGATYGDHDLGDVSVTRAAKFRLSDEFKNEAFNGKTYRSEKWKVPTKHFTTARELMRSFADNVREPAFAPPTKRYAFSGPALAAPTNVPDIKLEGAGGIPEFHPILTTDFFEFGTSANGLEHLGIGVEMGDAVLGLVCDELGDRAPNWGVVRNFSDPQINADAPLEPIDMQAHWAVWYYEQYGYWTSVMGALATWAIIAGYDL
jgi:nucleoside phosphorylase